MFKGLITKLKNLFIILKNFGKFGLQLIFLQNIWARRLLKFFHNQIFRNSNEIRVPWPLLTPSARKFPNIISLWEINTYDRLDFSYYFAVCVNSKYKQLGILNRIVIGISSGILKAKKFIVWYQYYALLPYVHLMI